MENKREVIFSILMAMFIVVLMLTNIIGAKLFLAFPDHLPNGIFGQSITLTAGLITYPITFLLTDIVCEVFGRRRANLMVLTGFGMSLFTLILVQITLALPGSPVWATASPYYETVDQMQRAFESVFTLPGTLIFASMTAYLAAQLLDVKLFHFFKQLTRGRHLWLRNNASTMMSQLVDTIIVNTIFLGFGLDLGWTMVGKIIVASYLFKLLIALADTPFCYLGVWALHRFAGIPVRPPRVEGAHIADAVG